MERSGSDELTFWLLQKAQYVILLSGTPALSRPIELFKQVYNILIKKFFIGTLHTVLNYYQVSNRREKNYLLGVCDLKLCAWQLEALYPNVYKNVHEYGNRYCKGVSQNSPASEAFSDILQQ